MVKKSTLMSTAGTLLVLASGTTYYLTQAHSDTEPSTPDAVATAPAPSNQFTDATCPAPAAIDSPKLEPHSWFAPSLNASATFHPSEALPTESVSDEGIIYSPSQKIGSTEGVSLLAGHVDLEPGVLSDRGGELTAWGHLHQVKACDLFYTADDQGKVSVSQVTGVIVAPQFDPELEDKAKAEPQNKQLQEALKKQQELEARIFTASGPAKVDFLTCSGPSVADVGGVFQFRYTNNLIIETTLVPGT